MTPAATTTGPRGDRVVAAIASYNGRRLLEQTLPSVAAQTVPGLRVVVVDDGSSDQTVAWLAQEWPEVRVIAHERNAGVTAALNTCLGSDPDAEWVALLNNDMELDPHCLAELLAALQRDDRAAAAVPKLREHRERGNLDGAGDFYLWSGEANRRGQGQEDRGQFDEGGEVFAANGGAVLYRRAALDAVGGFDERFFAIYEDVDWSFRARLAGWRCLYVPTAVAYHMGSATLGQELSDFVLLHNWRNAIWVVIKNYPAPSLVRHLPTLVWTQARNLGWALRQGRGRIWARAWREALAALPGVLRDRRAIQRRRVVGERDLARIIGPPG